MSKGIKPEQSLSQQLEPALESVQEALWAEADVVESMSPEEVRAALETMGLSSENLFQEVSQLVPTNETQLKNTETSHDPNNEMTAFSEVTPAASTTVEEPGIGEPEQQDSSEEMNSSATSRRWKALASMLTLVICVWGATYQYSMQNDIRQEKVNVGKTKAALLVRKGTPRQQVAKTQAGPNVPQNPKAGNFLPKPKDEGKSTGSTTNGVKVDRFTDGSKVALQDRWSRLRLGVNKKHYFRYQYDPTDNDKGEVFKIFDPNCPTCRQGRRSPRFQGQGKRAQNIPSPEKLRAVKKVEGISEKSGELSQKGRGEGKDGKGQAERQGKKGKKDPRVWRRTTRNTVLSKVSVGGGKYLKLHKMQITVQISGLRARTVLDHIYYNPYGRTLQGTFKYTLPAEASVSYYAMFVGTQRRRAPRFFIAGKGPRALRGLLDPKQLAKKVPPTDWGKLREARLVPAAKGRKVYEDITRRRIDPALLEQDAPNTFRGRVFPIPSKGYNRIIIAYEHTLPQSGNDLVYRLPFAPDVAQSIDLSLGYDKKLASLSSHNLYKQQCKGLSPKASPFVRCMWEGTKPKRDAVFTFRPKRKDISWAAGTDPTDNQNYLLARMRVNLPRSKKPYSAPQAVFMLDTSLSETPDLFAAHVALLRKVLERNQATLQHFNVLFFDVGAVWASPKGWIANTPENRKKLFRRIDSLLLEGATDVGRALQALSKPSWSIKRGVPIDIFFLSDGQHNWGSAHVDRAMKQFHKTKPFGQTRFFAYRMGLGSENMGLYHHIARSGGGVFPCLGRSELSRCASAHTQPSMMLEQVTLHGIEAREVFLSGSQLQLYPDSLLGVAARYQKNGNATIKLTGLFRGKRIVLTKKFPVKARGDLAPRAWAELAVKQLLALRKPKLTPLIVAYSRHFRIPNKHTSFLVLETDKEYKQYGLDSEPSKARVKDLVAFVTKQRSQKQTVTGPVRRWRDMLTKGIKQTRLKKGRRLQMIRSMMQQLSEQSLPNSSRLSGMRLWRNSDVPSSYLKKYRKQRDGFSLFVREAKRRLNKSHHGALRSLSCIVELHPSHPQALRLVGYHLMAWKRYDEASQVFLKLLERRPFEPHSYRDLARALAQGKRWGLAAALYEIVLAGQWDSRFGQIRTIVREEYALLVAEALKKRNLPASIMMLLLRRKALLGLHVKPSKLRVTVTWNTDNTDIDLWVIEPNGETCKYNHRQTQNGGVLLQDITRGYGPERYINRSGKSGVYQVKLNFYGHSSNVFGNQTHATVVIVTHAGTPQQTTIVKNIILQKKATVRAVLKVKL